MTTRVIQPLSQGAIVVSKRTKRRNNQNQKSLTGDVTIPRNLFSTMNRIYYFRRKASSTIITQAVGAEVKGVFSFTLQSVVGYSDLTTLFDLYRIAYVEVDFKPMYTMQQISNLTTQATSNLFTVLDMDDDNAPASIAELEEYGTCKVTNFNEKHVRTLRPHFALFTYPNTPTQANSPTGMWLDCASPTVKYFGVKYGIEGAASGQTNLMSWKVNFTMYIELKHSR